MLRVISTFVSDMGSINRTQGCVKLRGGVHVVWCACVCVCVCVYMYVCMYV